MKVFTVVLLMLFNVFNLFIWMFLLVAVFDNNDKHKSLHFECTEQTQSL